MELTTAHYAKIATQAAFEEVRIECEGDVELLAMGIGLLAGGGSAEGHLKQMLDSLKAYTEYGRPTGDFLLAILENDLKEAFGRADNLSRWMIMPLVKYVYNNMPGAAQGSPEKVKAWLEMKAIERNVRP